MQTMRSYDPAVEAIVGYAAAEGGNGLAYVRVTGAQSKQLLRIGFRVTAPPAVVRPSDWLRRAHGGIASPG